MSDPWANAKQPNVADISAAYKREIATMRSETLYTKAQAGALAYEAALQEREACAHLADIQADLERLHFKDENAPTAERNAAFAVRYIGL